MGHLITSLNQTGKKRNEIWGKNRWPCEWEDPNPNSIEMGEKWKKGGNGGKGLFARRRGKRTGGKRRSRKRANTERCLERFYLEKGRKGGELRGGRGDRKKELSEKGGKRREAVGKPCPEGGISSTKCLGLKTERTLSWGILVHVQARLWRETVYTKRIGKDRTKYGSKKEVKRRLELQVPR